MGVPLGDNEPTPSAGDQTMRTARRMILPVTAILIAAAAALSTGPAGEPASEGDPWSQIRFLVGTWEGTGEGRWGTSTVRRTYEFVLDDSFLMYRNESIYPPQEKNPTGEHHKDWGIYSYDKSRSALVLRQFHNEAIVSRFVSDSIADDVIVMTTEHIENFIPGWRTRETYRILGADSFEEIFEMAPPDGEFKVFVTNRLTRKP